MLRLIRFIAPLAVLGLISGCGTTTTGGRAVKDTTRSFTTVVVDAGHGGKDNGAYRKYGGAEKVATLDVARRVERKLRESQLRTVMTRNSDVFIELDERVRIENRQQNAVFVSIHFNDARRRGVQGFETYYHSSTSREMAQRIQSSLMTMPRAVNRGVHFANFRVLRNAQIPAVLVECGYLSNKREGGEVRDSDYRERLADKIAAAIVNMRYGRGTYDAPPAAANTAPASTGPGLAPAKLRSR